MIAQDFQILDDTVIDDSIRKRNFVKICDQHGVQENIQNQKIEFCCGEKLNYNQICYAFLELNIELREPDRSISTDADEIRLILLLLKFFKNERLLLLL